MKKPLVIVGSGIAGLSLALKLSEADSSLQITIITKGTLNDCNTRYAQGGIAAVMNKQTDSFESHIQDTLKCGKGLCDEEVVKMVVTQAPERIKELIAWGTKFDKTKEGSYDLAIEGGHSQSRVLHHKDMTGQEIESVLISHIKNLKNISVLEYHSILDLITESKAHEIICTGIKVIDWKNNKLKNLPASKVILASGGCGQVYLNTTNPSVATGDGYAMAARAGAELRNMQFMQFHPTALFFEDERQVSFLISEALRGFGAYIVNKENIRFLFKYDRRGELATRDVVSSAIIDHLKSSGEACVYMDLRHLDLKDVKKQFPAILEELIRSGFDPTIDLIPVTPSAHYQCGGIVVNSKGMSSIKNLFAIGEVSCTGLHGANRLASNSLLEALVYAHNCSLEILKTKNDTLDDKLFSMEIIEWERSDKTEVLKKIIKDVKTRMSSSAFQNNKFLLLKDKDHLLFISSEVESRIQKSYFSSELLDLRNILGTAILILQSKLEARPEKQKVYNN